MVTRDVLPSASRPALRGPESDEVIPVVESALTTMGIDGESVSQVASETCNLAS